MSIAVNMKKLCEAASAKMYGVRDAVLIEFGSSVIKDTPVKTRRAQSNWRASRTVALAGEVKIRPQRSTIAALKRVVRSMKGDNSFFFTNNVPYIRRLEDGWSGQAPSGMVRKNLARMNQMARKVIRSFKKGRGRR